MPITEIRSEMQYLLLYPSLSRSVSQLHPLLHPRVSELPTHARNKSSISVYHGIYFRNCVAIVLEPDDVSSTDTIVIDLPA